MAHRLHSLITSPCLSLSDWLKYVPHCSPSARTQFNLIYLKTQLFSSSVLFGVPCYVKFIEVIKKFQTLNLCHHLMYQSSDVLGAPLLIPPILLLGYQLIIILLIHADILIIVARMLSPGTGRPEFFIYY
jgi:hypothetical protein